MQQIFGTPGPVEGCREEWLHLEGSAGETVPCHLKRHDKNGIYHCCSFGKCIVKYLYGCKFLTGDTGDAVVWSSNAYLLP